MKAQFYLGIGLGMAAGAAGAMLMQPREMDLKKALGSARQTLDQALKKIGG